MYLFLIENAYFNDQIMFLKCLNDISYLSDYYMCLLILIHEMIYARYYSSLSTNSSIMKNDIKHVVA